MSCFAQLNGAFKKIIQLGHRCYTSSSVTQMKSWREIPGPSKLEVIRQQLFNFIPGKGNVSGMNAFEGMQYLLQKYGRIARIDGLFGVPTMVHIFDPESIAQIHRKENWYPVRPTLPTFEYFAKEYNKSRDDILKNEPTGLFTDHGENWRKLRLILNPLLLKPEILKLYQKYLNDIAIDFVQRIRNLRDENNMIKNNLDIQFNYWASKSVAMVALGRHLGEHSDQLVRCVQKMMQNSEDLDFKSNTLWRYFITKRMKQAMMDYQEMMDICEYFIKEAKKEYKKEQRPEDKQSVLEKLLQVDERIATILASDMLFAGVHPTAHATMLLLYCLATNPEKQTKLRNEIFSEDNNKKYMRACIKESMRLLPVIPGNVRRTTKEHHVLGYKIPQNMLLGFGHYCSSVDENQYLNANSYLPERWLVNESDPLHYGKAHPFSMSPFGYGSRMCVGKRLAEMDIQYFLTHFLRNFQVDWVGPPAKIKTTSLNFMVDPFSFVFKDL